MRHRAELREHALRDPVCGRRVAVKDAGRRQHQRAVTYRQGPLTRFVRLPQPCQQAAIAVAAFDPGTSTMPGAGVSANECVAPSTNAPLPVTIGPGSWVTNLTSASSINRNTSYGPITSSVVMQSYKTTAICMPDRFRPPL